MTVETLEDAVKACEISLEEFHKKAGCGEFWQRYFCG